ncbi:hypothetical protein BH11ACT6_BH11ACT6_05150 [soil metagenome]
MDKLTAELVAAVASAAVQATLVAAGAPKTPTTPRPSVKMPSTPKPIKHALAVDRDQLAICVHEAAHAVSGTVLGAELRNAVVGELRDGLKGQTFFYDRPSGTDPQISYAGPYGEGKFLSGGRRPTQREFYNILGNRGCRDRKVLVAAGGIHTGADVELIVDRCWSSVLSLAGQLHRTGEVVREDVLRALGVDTSRPAASQLANIRAGMQPVPPFNPKTPAPA